MLDARSLKSSFNLKHFIKTVVYKNNFYKLHPSYFVPDGLLVFIGAQGSGKTLSAVNYIYNVMALYPDCILVTNVELKKFPIDGKRVFWFNDSDDLKKYNNGEKGVLFFIDEIQIYLNSLESKNISMEVITEISQQRKQRKHIVSTSQVFGRLAKPLREQFNIVCVCRCFFGLFQYNRYIKQEDSKTDSDSMHIEGKPFKVEYYFHRPAFYARYDTYAKIERSNFVDVKGGVSIYDRGNSTAGASDSD